MEYMYVYIRKTSHSTVSSQAKMTSCMVSIIYEHFFYTTLVYCSHLSCNVFVFLN